MRKEKREGGQPANGKTYAEQDDSATHEVSEPLPDLPKWTSTPPGPKPARNDLLS